MQCPVLSLDVGIGEGEQRCKVHCLSASHLVCNRHPPSSTVCRDLAMSVGRRRAIEKETHSLSTHRRGSTGHILAYIPSTKCATSSSSRVRRCVSAIGAGEGSRYSERARAPHSCRQCHRLRRQVASPWSRCPANQVAGHRSRCPTIHLASHWSRCLVVQRASCRSRCPTNPVPRTLSICSNPW